jgi:hypothetical protein
VSYIYSNEYPQFRIQPSALSADTDATAWWINHVRTSGQTASASYRQSQALIEWNIYSIRLKSGEYGGRYISLAPAGVVSKWSGIVYCIVTNRTRPQWVCGLRRHDEWRSCPGQQHFVGWERGQDGTVKTEKLQQYCWLVCPIKKKFAKSVGSLTCKALYSETVYLYCVLIQLFTPDEFCYSATTLSSFCSIWAGRLFIHYLKSLLWIFDDLIYNYTMLGSIANGENWFIV